MSVYFIDYENVHESGLKGIAKLTENDVVFLFYSNAAQSISIDTMLFLREAKARIEYLKVNGSGKNYLDFQLATVLGVQAYQNPDKDFVIISNDNGYRSLIDFWEGRPADGTIIHCRTQKSIGDRPASATRGQVVAGVKKELVRPAAPAAVPSADTTKDTTAPEPAVEVPAEPAETVETVPAAVTPEAPAAEVKEVSEAPAVPEILEDIPAAPKKRTHRGGRKRKNTEPAEAAAPQVSAPAAEEKPAEKEAEKPEEIAEPAVPDVKESSALPAVQEKKVTSLIPKPQFTMQVKEVKSVVQPVKSEAAESSPRSLRDFGMKNLSDSAKKRIRQAIKGEFELKPQEYLSLYKNILKATSDADLKGRLVNVLGKENGYASFEKIDSIYQELLSQVSH